MNTRHPKQRASISSPRSHQRRIKVVGILLGTCLLSGSVGCQTWGSGKSGSGKSGSWIPGLPFGSVADSQPASSPSNLSDDQSESAASGSTLLEQIPGTNRLVGFVTGEQSDIPRAKQLYRQGDQLFKQASREPKSKRTSTFAKAADLFAAAAAEAPGSGLQQDALFMQGESLFFANELTASRDALETLQKNFPRNRHSDRAAARLFAISKYWIDVSKSDGDSWYSVNLFDSTRPMRSPDAHAIRILDQIRYDDPTGKLADDATMAAAAEYIRQEEYEQADEFLTDLRETFTDSDHMFLAHLLGIRCKLKLYAGPKYSERVLDEAETLISQTRRRFPNELKDEKYSEMIARAAAEVAFHKAEKLAYRAKYRERQNEFGSARELYRKILRDHPTTPHAEAARDTLAKIEKLPDSAQQNVAFRAIAKAFPSSSGKPPLETVDSKQSPQDVPTESTGEKIMR